MRWTPHVTVAAIAERQGTLLLVEEAIGGRLVLNQPAGHWEEDESLIDAVQREVLEETGYCFTPEALVGIYRWDVPDRDITYLRFVFTGQVGPAPVRQTLDGNVLRALWLSPEELQTEHARLRSPMVLRCVQDYLAGRRFPLEILNEVA
jgi:8-oxo-dGTP pyrophosphatase MutT (NUDIX family)